MKKKPFRYPFGSARLNLILLKMKLTVLLSFAFFLTGWGTSLSQTVKLSLDLKRVPVEKVIQMIEDQTEFYFLYQDDVIKKGQTVTIQMKDTPVEMIMQQLTGQIGVDYRILDDQIILLPKDKPAETLPPLSPRLEQQPQRREITGNVKDARGIPLPGVSVFVKGTTTGTVTGRDGQFQLQVPNDTKSLVFSFIGMKTYEINIAGETRLNVVMEEEVRDVDEIIVVGYGQMRKSDLTGSLITVAPDKINKGQQITVQDALIGKISGVNVVNSSGAPGSGATIRIRMGSSLSASNDPLIIIDGVPVDNSSIRGANNILGLINPNDIATFTVLKDASATAIYGSRASNGVIIITTQKGGTDGGKLKLQYSNNFTFSNLVKYEDVLNAEEFRNAFKKYAAAPVNFQLGNATTDWQKEIYQVGFGNEHNFSVSGNLAESPYRISLGYTDQNGIIKRSNYNRITGGIALNHKFFQKSLSMDINIKGSNEKNNIVSGDIASSAVAFDPTRPVFETYSNNVGKGYFTWIAGGAPIAIAPVNPVSNIDLFENLNTVLRSIGSITFDYKIPSINNLRFNLNLGYDILKSERENTFPQFAPVSYTQHRRDGTGLDYYSVQKKSNNLLDFYTNYTATIKDDHYLEVMAGYGWQHFWNNFRDRNHDTFGVELSAPGYSESEYYLLSLFGRLNYNYKQKYLITSTIRSDASSRFSKENRMGYFPSFAIAWRIKNEDFLKDANALSDLKLRLSYGQTGQQDIGSDYPYMVTYTASRDEARYKFGDRWYTTYRPNGYDPNIKWETTESMNAGIDISLIQNRISASVDGYIKNTKDLLNHIFVPAGSNFTNVIYTNIGSMKNQGIEFSLNTVPVRKKDFNWVFSSNFTWNTSKITKLNVIDTEKNYVKTGSAGGTGNFFTDS